MNQSGAVLYRMARPGTGTEQRRARLVSTAVAGAGRKVFLEGIAW